MIYLVLAITLVGLGLFVATQVRGAPPPVAQAAQVKGLSRAQLKEKLQKLAATKVPETSSRPPDRTTAMCYAVGPPTKRAEYVCRRCGERTIYKIPVDSEFEEVGVCRSLVRDLQAKGLVAELDDTSYCRRCEPKGSDGLSLTVRYPNEKEPVVARGVTAHDLRLLLSLLDGRAIFSEPGKGQEPLKNSLLRLRELLGLKEEK